MRKTYRFKVVKLALLLLVAAPAFVAFAVSLLVQRPDHPMVWVVCILCILFFGGGFLLGAVNLPRVIRDSTALILTPEAIIMRHTGRAEQTVIRWTQIAGFAELCIKGEHFITPQLRSPEPRIGRERNPFMRKLMKWNTNYTGSPYSIGTGVLRCDPDELIATLIDYLEKYGEAEGDSADKQS